MIFIKKNFLSEWMNEMNKNMAVGYQFFLKSTTFIIKQQQRQIETQRYFLFNFLNMFINRIFERRKNKEIIEKEKKTFKIYGSSMLNHMEEKTKKEKSQCDKW